jgi:hypothetical protein
MRFKLALAALAFSAVAFADDTFQIRYASNLAVGDSFVNITNTGATVVNGSASNLCANIYTFDSAEELISCCSCPVTPNGLAPLSVRHDLISNTLTAGSPTSVVLKIVATVRTISCNASTVTADTLAHGLLAWGTTLHLNTATPTPTYHETETAFSSADLSTAELRHITSTCGFIQADGSGFGICRSCGLGGLGASTSNQ